MKRIQLIVVAVVLLTLILCGCSKTNEKFMDQVEAGNYNKAIEIYQEKIEGNATLEQETRAELEQYLSDNWEKYIEENISENEFKAVLLTLEKINNAEYLLPNLDDISWELQYIQESKDSYQRGKAALEAENYEEAIEELSYVVPEDTKNYSDAIRTQERALEAYHDKIISSVRSMIDSGKYDEANSLLYYAEGYLRNYDDIENLFIEISSEKAESQIKSAFDEGNYLEVVLLYESMVVDNNNVQPTAEMTEWFTYSRNEYLTTVLNNAQTAFGDSKDYSAAIAVIQSALAEANASDDLTTELEQKVEEYLTYQPVPLTSLECIQKSEYLLAGGIYAEEDIYTDVNGTVYDKDNLLFPTITIPALTHEEQPRSEDDYYILYNLNYNYSEFSGIVFRPYCSLSSTEEWDNPTIVKIYGDGVLLYEAPSYTKETYDAYDFTINVSGVRNLKIIIIGTWANAEYSGHYRPKVCMGNLMLQK